MGKKYTQFTEDTAPTDDDILLGVDVATGLTKRHTRSSLLTANPIVDPTITGDADGDIFVGKFNGWIDSDQLISVNSNPGNNIHVLKITGVDATDQFSAGMKGYIDRSVAAPTQCTDLEATTTQQYWNRAAAGVSGIAFTDDWTTEAWVKPESYAANASIIGRGPGATNSDWAMRIESQGQLGSYGRNGSGNGKIFSSYQFLPLNRWSHVATTNDFSGGSGLTYINGVSVANTGLTNLGAGATSIVQSGDLMIGKNNATSDFFDGKIAEVRLWNVVRTAAQIRDNANHQLTGSETNLIGYWKFNGNGNDATSNGNNLTATGTGTTPTATNADHPYSDREYFKILKVELSGSDTLLTVHTGMDNLIPNTSITNFHYSVHDSPHGFPQNFAILFEANVSYSQGSITSIVDLLGVSLTIDVPADTSLEIYYRANLQSSVAADVGSIRLYEGSNGIHTTYDVLRNANNQENKPGRVIWRPPSAGSYTYKIAVQRDAGSGTLTNAASTGLPAVLSIKFYKD